MKPGRFLLTALVFTLLGGGLRRDYHGDWYDDFVIGIEGKNCRLNVTYRM